MITREKSSITAQRCTKFPLDRATVLGEKMVLWKVMICENRNIELGEIAKRRVSQGIERSRFSQAGYEFIDIPWHPDASDAVLLDKYANRSISNKSSSSVKACVWDPI